MAPECKICNVVIGSFEDYMKLYRIGSTLTETLQSDVILYHTECYRAIAGDCNVPDLKRVD